MKKLLLSAVAVVAAMQIANAQNVSTWAIDYNAGTDLTCLSGAAIQATATRSGAAFSPSPAYISSKDYDYANNKALTFTVGSSTPAPGTAADPLWFDIFYKKGPVGPTQTCNPFSEDDDNITMATNTKVCIIAKSSVAGSKFKLDLWSKTIGGNPWVDDATTYSMTGSTQIVKEVGPLTTSYAAYELDFGTEALFTSWANKNTIQGFGVQATTVFDGATVSIQRITFGNTATCAVATTSASSATLVNDQVNVFPNPAKGAFNVDVTAMNVESALVKVMNANGTVVKEVNVSGTSSISTEGLNAGIYMIQVTAENKVANKKVVVQ